MAQSEEGWSEDGLGLPISWRQTVRDRALQLDNYKRGLQKWVWCAAIECIMQMGDDQLKRRASELEMEHRLQRDRFHARAGHESPEAAESFAEGMKRGLAALAKGRKGHQKRKGGRGEK